MITFAVQMYKKILVFRIIDRFKNIMSDFAATHNPFNQNLNYEKILRFSEAKIGCFLIPPKYNYSFLII